MLSDTKKKKILARLKRVEGQVAGIHRMVDGDAYCVDVLHQLSAARGALEQVTKIILSTHVETCVAETFETGSEADRRAKIQELVGVVSLYGNH